LWISLSLVWAEDVGKAAHELWRWYVGALVLAVVATSLRRTRDIRLVIGGFVVGVVASVVIGLVHDPLGGAAMAVPATSPTQGRLIGGLGDPNFLAAAIVPAIVLAVALMAVVQASARRALLILAAVMVVGLAATESRGGLVAAAVAFGAALLVMRGRRGRILGAGVGVLLIGALYFAAHPSGLHRINTSDSGNGRTELWEVAWRISAHHPLVGVGLHNFTVYSPRYVRQAGALSYVDLIAERPHVVHNTYLEVLVETGIVGLGLFLGVIGASLGAVWRAAVRFGQSGAFRWETLARGVLVADIGVLTAAFFVTVSSQPMFWFLLALGPALLVVAERRNDEASVLQKYST
jgi:O-antigen ligase